MGFIYMLTSPYGKSYIGQTIRPIEERLKEHQLPGSRCVAIYKAICFHGWENFEKHWYEVPNEDLNDHEELMVEVFETLAPNGYNLKEGGGSRGKMCDEVKQKISIANLGRVLSKENRKNMSIAQKGKNKTDEHKQKISASNIGKTRTDEARQKMRDAKKSKKESFFKKVYQYNLDGTFIQSFASSGDAAQSFNKNSGVAICKCANDKLKTAYGFKWSYTKL